jgi:MYXO-CTERM domain-containing protein
MQLPLLRIASLALFAWMLSAAPTSLSAATIDVRAAWAYNGIPDPGSYAPNPVPADFNEFKGVFTNQNQTAGDNAANLHDAISPYGLTGVGVTWDGWRRFNSNDPAAFASDRDWVDRAGSGSQLSGNDDGSPTNSSVTFSGLLPNGAYQVEVVMTGVGGSLWDVEINSLNANHSFGNTPAQNAAVGAWAANANGSDQRDWLVWDSALASAGGSLTINFFTANNAGVDGLHAIRLTGIAAPEPTGAALALLAAGAVTMLQRRRKLTV